MSELTILIIADKNNAGSISALIESIRAFNDVPSLTTVLFDNEAGPELRNWGSAQEDIVFVYSDEGEIPFGKAVMDAVRGLPIIGDLLIVPGTHMLIPGTLSGMMKIMDLNKGNAVIGANFLGSRYYGLGRDFLIDNYKELAEYSMSCNYGPYETDRLDPDGTILIGRSFLEQIVDISQLDKLDEKEFKNAICAMAEEIDAKVLVDRADFWGDNSAETHNAEKNDGVILSICVPTYNRGKIALDLGEKLLKDRAEYGLEDEVEVFFSDNGSEMGKEEYVILKELAEKNKNYEYVRNPENLGFEGNMMNVYKKCKGKWALILSDEDRLNFAVLKVYIMYLKKHTEIAVMKGYTDRMYARNKPLYVNRGATAIDAFFVQGNYVSGVIYNRDILTEKIVDEMHALFAGGENRAYFWYPHLFWDAYGLLNGSFASSDLPLVIEGETGYSADKVIGSKIMKYAYPDERIAQGLGYLKLIGYLNIKEDSLATRIFLMAFQKTLVLVNLNIKEYANEGIDCSSIVDEMADRFKEAFTGEGFSDKKACYHIIERFIESNRKSFKQAYTKG